MYILLPKSREKEAEESDCSTPTTQAYLLKSLCSFSFSLWVCAQKMNAPMISLFQWWFPTGMFLTILLSSSSLFQRLLWSGVPRYNYYFSWGGLVWLINDGKGEIKAMWGSPTNETKWVPASEALLSHKEMTNQSQIDPIKERSFSPPLTLFVSWTPPRPRPCPPPTFVVVFASFSRSFSSMIVPKLLWPLRPWHAWDHCLVRVPR